MVFSGKFRDILYLKRERNKLFCRLGVYFDADDVSGSGTSCSSALM